MREPHVRTRLTQDPEVRGRPPTPQLKERYISKGRVAHECNQSGRERTHDQASPQSPSCSMQFSLIILAYQVKSEEEVANQSRPGWSLSVDLQLRPRTRHPSESPRA
jgi:hypothetical protein